MFIFATRGKCWIRRERVSERSSFARVRVIYIYADEEILSAFFSLSPFLREKKDFARNFTRGGRGGNAKVEWAHARLICARVHSLRATTTIREAG